MKKKNEEEEATVEVQQVAQTRIVELRTTLEEWRRRRMKKKNEEEEATVEVQQVVSIIMKKKNEEAIPSVCEAFWNDNQVCQDSYF